MKDIIIFGRSPFINQIDFSKIDYNKFDICCINYPIYDVKVHYLVSADSWVKPVLAPKTEWISKNTGWDIISTDLIITEEGKLSWRAYSSSLAVNFAILRGYKNIYLAGIDLMDANYKHYDDDSVYIKDKDSYRIEKDYILLLRDYYKVNIYQLNKEADWLEYRNINICYNLDKG